MKSKTHCKKITVEDKQKKSTDVDILSAWSMLVLVKEEED